MNQGQYLDENQLLNLKEKVVSSLKTAPEGKMHCEMAQGKYPQYYILDEKESQQFPRGRYLRKEEIELARCYAQKEYDLLMLAAIDRKLKEIRKLSRKKETEYLEDIIYKMSKGKQCLVTPYMLTNEVYQEEWEKTRLEIQNTIPILNGFKTEKGEMVRSKTEKMIADKLFLRKIPYKYEAGILANNQKMIFPDFTLLNVRTRKEYFLEHFGMMDNPEYCKKAISRIEEYAQNNIYLGEKLLVTFESSLKGVNMSQIDFYIDKYLL